MYRQGWGSVHLPQVPGYVLTCYGMETLRRESKTHLGPPDLSKPQIAHLQNENFPEMLQDQNIIFFLGTFSLHLS